MTWTDIFFARSIWLDRNRMVINHLYRHWTIIIVTNIKKSPNWYLLWVDQMRYICLCIETTLGCRIVRTQKWRSSKEDSINPTMIGCYRNINNVEIPKICTHTCRCDRCSMAKWARPKMRSDFVFSVHRASKRGWKQSKGTTWIGWRWRCSFCAQSTRNGCVSHSTHIIFAKYIEIECA